MPPDKMAKSRILRAAVNVLLAAPPERATLDLVAKKAGCAKGLIHYHFKTKEALLAAAAADLWGSRTAAWKAAMAEQDPSTAIGAAWNLIEKEAASGAHGAAIQLATRADDLIGRTARDAASEFRETLSSSTQQLLQRMGRSLTVPAGEAAELLVSTVTGLGTELEMGVDPGRVQAAWAAFWVGLLALSR